MASLTPRKSWAKLAPTKCSVLTQRWWRWKRGNEKMCSQSFCEIISSYCCSLIVKVCSPSVLKTVSCGAHHYHCHPQRGFLIIIIQKIIIEIIIIIISWSKWSSMKSSSPSSQAALRGRSGGRGGCQLWLETQCWRVFKTFWLVLPSFR